MKAGERASDGFSMVELMVALVLLLIAALGTLGLLTSSVTSDAGSRTATAATAAAEAEIEELRSIGYTNVSNGNDSVTVDGNVYNRAWAVTDVAANALRKVDVTVTWGWNNQLVMSVYIARNS